MRRTPLDSGLRNREDGCVRKLGVLKYRADGVVRPEAMPLPEVPPPAQTDTRTGRGGHALLHNSQVLTSSSSSSV